MEKIIVIAENRKMLKKTLEQSFWQENGVDIKGICVPDAEAYVRAAKNNNTTVSNEDAARLFFECDRGFLYMLDSIEHQSADKNTVYKGIADIIFKKEERLLLYADKNCGTKSALTSLFAIKCELLPRVDNETIDSAVNYITSHPEGDLRQTSVAEKLYINSSYLSTVFTAHTNRRFVDYVNDVRLRRAARLLLSTDLKIADIAERLEYHDLAYFSKLFKRKFGMTPSLYRIPDNYNYQI